MSSPFLAVKLASAGSSSSAQLLGTCRMCAGGTLLSLFFFFRARKGPRVRLAAMVSKAPLVCPVLLDLRDRPEKTVTRSADRPAPTLV